MVFIKLDYKYYEQYSFLRKFNFKTIYLHDTQLHMARRQPSCRECHTRTEGDSPTAIISPITPLINKSFNFSVDMVENSEAIISCGQTLLWTGIGLRILDLGCVLRTQPDCSKGCIFFLEPIPIPFTTIYAMLTYQDAGMLILDLGCDLRTQPDCFKGSQRPCPSPYAL